MENKAVLFLSHLIPHESYGEVNRLSKNNMQDAANALQWHLAEGFCHHLDGGMDLINLLPIASYPLYYRRAFLKKMHFDAGCRAPGVSIGFCNVKGIRRGSIYRRLRREVLLWASKNAGRDRVILVYTLNPILLRVLSDVKKTHADITVCAIVADLPDMMHLSDKDDYIRRLLTHRVAEDSYKFIPCVDHFVLLTKQMADYLGTDKPYIVMEGIAPETNADSATVADGEVKTILYTGTLHRKFGMEHLLCAFAHIPDPAYRLVICGVGDSEDAIVRAAQKDSRILFKGKCSREEVLRLQREATVLVNPRQNNEEFTKYSFPSKNLEYLASGVPLVAYKLDGIPDEYDPYIRYVPDDTPETLAETLRAVCEADADTRRAIGERAARFVGEHKNRITQTRRILDFLEIPSRETHK